ncbi:MAG: hypothetical protein JNN15_18425 [Blastocatellia bacterium]|nr:hypothetical protein [Blastocatellia bacterium]
MVKVDQKRFEKTLEAFLKETEQKTEPNIALRALVLHMLEGYIPETFRKLNLPSKLRQSLKYLKEIPIRIEPGLDLSIAMARVDRVFIETLREIKTDKFNLDALQEYIDSISFVRGGAYAWLMAQESIRAGHQIDTEFFLEEILINDSPLDYIYYLTHLFLFETDYLQKPLSKPDSWEPQLLQLRMSIEDIVKNRAADVAAEVAICFQLVGKHYTVHHTRLVETIITQQREDGTVLDPFMEQDIAHTTSAALVAFAGIMKCQNIFK